MNMTLRCCLRTRVLLFVMIYSIPLLAMAGRRATSLMFYRKQLMIMIIIIIALLLPWTPHHCNNHYCHIITQDQSRQEDRQKKKCLQIPDHISHIQPTFLCVGLVSFPFRFLSKLKLILRCFSFVSMSGLSVFFSGIFQSSVLSLFLNRSYLFLFRAVSLAFP